MGKHQLETIDSYMLYCNLLHVDMFKDTELNETIVKNLQYFKKNIGDCYGSKGEMLQDKLKVKLGMFRDLIILMFSDECMFSFPMKATCLKTDGSIQDTEDCLKTRNAYKAFLKYVQIFSRTNTLSEEFRRAWCGEGSFQTIENLKMVYPSVYTQKKNCTPTQTMVLADGAVMVDGSRFSPDLVSRLYGKLLNTYEECLDGLRAFTGFIFVQHCYKLLRGTYCYQKECSFYSCFPEELNRALIENVDSTCFEGVAYKSTLHLFDELCSAIVALVLLSSDSTLRLQEYTRLM